MSHAPHPSRILVIRGGAIGDFILTLPVLAALRQAFPSAPLAVMGYPHIARLALASRLADEVLPLETRGMAAMFAPGATIPRDIVELFARFDLIVSFLFDPESIFANQLKRCGGARFVTGPHRPRDDGGVHATEVFLSALRPLNLHDLDPVPRLSIPSRGDEVERPRPCLAVHPGSGGERKNWPEKDWADLLRRLAKSPGLGLLLVGGEAEGQRLDRLASLWPADRLSVWRNRPLEELAAALARCDGFVGHDSGITHLAAAVGQPGIALWGGTAEAVWRPRSARFRVLHGGEGLPSLSVDQVFAAVQALLAGHEHA